MCDTWVALRDVTRDRSLIFAKNSDRPIFDCQPLMFAPRATWPAGATLQLEYRTLPQVPLTYATLGASPYWCWGYETGINEHGVAIGNEAIFTRTFRAAARAFRGGEDVALGLLGMDLVRLALERSRSAAEAVTLMGAFVEQYGQFGSGVPGKDHAAGGYDNAFLVVDSSEAWTFEALGRRWAARRTAAGSTSISNQLSIRTAWDAGSADLSDYARQQDWWPAETALPFDLAHAYADETVPRQVSHIRAMRSQQLLAEQHGHITPQWMMRIARDHYEGTFLNGPGFDPANPDFHSLCMHVSPADFTWGNTASSCVVSLPERATDPPVFWWTPGPPCNGCYVPFFVHGSRLPPIVSRAGTAGKQTAAPDQVVIDTWAPDSYWWLFRELMDRVKGDAVHSLPGFYPRRNPLVRARFDPLEQAFAARVPAAVQEYAATGDTAVLDRFTEQCVAQVTTALHMLLDEVKECYGSHTPQGTTASSFTRRRFPRRNR
jgi:secernin